MCDLCKENYGPCSLFENFLLTVKIFKGNVTRSKNATYQDDESNNKFRDSDDDVIYKELQNKVINEFLSQDLSVVQQQIKSPWMLYCILK